MQQRLQFFREIYALPSPEPAPKKIVRQVESARMAMRVSLSGHKHEAIAHRLGMSKGYFSRIVNEQQPMPEWFPRAFCYAVGCDLLRQYLALQDALNETHETARWLERKLAGELARACA